jgi:hypothetical protein
MPLILGPKFYILVVVTNYLPQKMTHVGHVFPGVGDGPVTLNFDLQKLTEMGAISKGSKGAELWSVVGR